MPVVAVNSAGVIESLECNMRSIQYKVKQAQGIYVNVKHNRVKYSTNTHQCQQAALSKGAFG